MSKFKFIKLISSIVWGGALVVVGANVINSLAQRFLY